MLAYFLAIVMAMISLTLYFNAFISPKTHRQDDFLWSGLGLFYALTLWICSGQITGAVLLGQLAIVSLAVAFIWENRQIRKQITAKSESNGILEGFSILTFILASFQKISQLTKKKTPVVTKETSPKTEEKTPEIKEESPTLEKTPTKEVIEEKVTETVIIETPSQEDTQTVESVIEEVIKEEIDVDIELSEVVSSESNLDDDDFDVNSLGLSSDNKEDNIDKEKKPNIFSKLLGFFRKSPPQEVTKKESNESVVDMEESEIDPNISATEVETAIDNLDIVDSNNENQEKNIDSDTVTKDFQEEIIESVSDKSIDTIEILEDLEKEEVIESIADSSIDTLEISEEIKEDEETENSIDTLEISQEVVENTENSIDTLETSQEVIENSINTIETLEDLEKDEVIESIADSSINTVETLEENQEIMENSIETLEISEEVKEDSQKEDKIIE